MNICNKIVSLFWAESKFIPDPDGNDYFSKLPLEVVGLIGQQLPSMDAKTLHHVNRKIQLATQELIDFEIIKKFEEIILNTPRPSPFFDFNTLPNKTEERIKKLREGICSWLLGFQNDIKLNHRLIWAYTQPFCNLEHQLATQILKIIHEDLNQPFLYHESNKFIQKCFFLAMDMLINSRINVKCLKVSIRTHKKHFFDFDPVVLEGPILTIILKAVQNQSINSVQFKVYEWKLDDLNQILEAIKNNDKIDTVEIIEGSSDNLFGYLDNLNICITEQLQPSFNKINIFDYVKNEWTFKR